MKQYGSFGEVTLAIMEKYENVVFLSKMGGDGKRCVYGEGANGVGCFVGCLVPEKYKPDLARHEGRSVGRLMEIWSGWGKIFLPNLSGRSVVAPEYEMWRFIQRAHDESSCVAEALSRLADIATGYGWVEKGDIPAQVRERINKWKRDEERKLHESIDEVRGVVVG